MNQYSMVWICLLMFQSIHSFGQPGNFELKLSNQKNVILYQDQIKENIYYYHPINLRLSISEQGPEFSFIAYSDQGDDDHPNAGIMHMLLVWGLDADQYRQVNQYLIAQIDSQAYLAGAMPVRHDAQTQLEITGTSNLVNVLRRSLTQSSSVPITPGNKMALSFKFSNDDFVRFNEALKDSKELYDVVFRIYLKSINYKAINELSNNIILEARLSHLIHDLI